MDIIRPEVHSPPNILFLFFWISLDELDLNIGNYIVVVPDSKCLSILASVYPVRAERIAVAEIEVARNVVVVEFIIYSPLFIQIQETGFRYRALMRWVLPRTHTRVVRAYDIDKSS